MCVRDTPQPDSGHGLLRDFEDVEIRHSQDPFHESTDDENQGASDAQREAEDGGA